MTRKSRRSGPPDDTGADRELNNDADRGAEPSRTERKRESKALTRLGDELLALPPERWDELELPERLAEALVEAKRLTSFGARRRQAQFIGKLMRKLDDESLARIRAALRAD
jgi:ribosome-associated protein